MTELEARIDELWDEGRVEAEPIEETIDLLDRGELRVAEPGPDGWVVNEWAKKHRIPVSKLMMPLSFATILGGLCTLIGTSTNVIMAGLMQQAVNDGRLASSLGFFTLTWVGVPCAIVGIATIVLLSRWLLPDRKRGYYHEYTVPTPGARNRGARRIVCGGPKAAPHACYYTADHYNSFARIRE